MVSHCIIHSSDHGTPSQRNDHQYLSPVHARMHEVINYITERAKRLPGLMHLMSWNRCILRD